MAGDNWAEALLYENQKCSARLDITGGCRLVRAKKAMEPAAPVSRFLYR